MPGRGVFRAAAAVLALTGLVCAVLAAGASQTHAAGRAEYPAALWQPAYAGNYVRANRPASPPILRVVIHTTEGSYTGTIRWFRNPASNVSTHYVIRSSDGQVTQMLAEKDIGIHAGNSYYNATTVAIEHEAFVRSCTWYTDAMYRSSARLVAYLVLKYGIPLDRAHVIGHNEVPDPGNPGRRGGSSNHSDPGPCWDWTKYMALVRQYAGRSDEAVVDDRTRGRFSAPGWRVDAKSPQRYGPGYRLAAPSPTGAPATFRIRVPANGSYAVYGWWPAYRNRNSAVPVWIASAAGPTSLTVDQRRFGRRWVYLGTFGFKKGVRSIQFSRRTSTPGVIGADAVKLEPVRTPAASELGPSSTGWALTPRQLSTTRDDGGSWSPITPPDAAAPTIRAVDFTDARTGRLVVLPSGAARGMRLLTTRNGGRDWSRADLPAPEDLDAGAPVSVAFPEDDAGFVAIRREGRGAGAGALLRTTDGGETWLESRLPAPGSIVFRTASEGWLTSAETGELYATRNGGRGWRVVRLPRPTAYRGAVALPGLPTFTDETTGVLPVTLAGARSAVSFLRSQDAGRTWRLAATVATRRPITTARLVPATVVDSSTWLAALEGGRRFVVVARGGASRVGVVPRSLPFGGSKPPVAEMRFASASAGWAQIATRCPVFHKPRCPDRQAVYRTADGGATWARLSPP